MSDTHDKSRVFQVVCPCCEATLWVDGESRSVLQSEKAKRKKGSLDDLLAKEKKRTEEFGRKFDSTFELQQKKLEKADEKFRAALTGIKDGDADDEKDES
jgi:hypothetical protein